MKPPCISPVGSFPPGVFPDSVRQSYLQQPGEPLCLVQFSHASAPSAQHSAVSLFSPQLLHSLAAASDPQPEKKAKLMEVSETNSSFFMEREPNAKRRRVKIMVCGATGRNGDAKSDWIGRDSARR